MSHGSTHLETAMASLVCSCKYVKKATIIAGVFVLCNQSRYPHSCKLFYRFLFFGAVKTVFFCLIVGLGTPFADLSLCAECQAIP